MIEDKLLRDERIRLEALNQAVQTGTIARGSRTVGEGIIELAAKYEDYVRNGKEES